MRRRCDARSRHAAAAPVGGAGDGPTGGRGRVVDMVPAVGAGLGRELTGAETPGRGHTSG
ncbi:hypothetical protein CcI49_12960 [Frankia sp. CcI49]|nr:hypothetical protein ACG83_05380 [Frankia sp. R43]ONH60278.1 hypothetical protein CcI49_12960 [Frankia sp. CcI49]